MSLRLRAVTLVPIFLLCVTVFLLNGNTATAQTAADAPIFLWVRGDLWQVSPADLSAPPVQVTRGGTLSAPALSPDGAWIVYKAAAPVGIEALGRLETEGLIAEFDLPSDLFVLNTTTGESRPLVGQPENPSLFVDGVPDRAISRSAPVWSPDGAQLAWTEIVFGEARASLFILNRDSMNGVSAPITMEVYGIPPEVEWFGETITVWQTLPTGLTRVERYGADGTLTGLLNVSTEAAGGSLETLVDLDGRLLILNDQGEWREIAADGSPAFVPSPQITIPGSTESFRVGFGHVNDAGFFWEAFDPLTPDATSVAFPGDPSRVTLSPDGRAIGFLGFPDFGSASIYRDGELLTIPNTGDSESLLNVGAILWGSPIWSAQ